MKIYILFRHRSKTFGGTRKRIVSGFKDKTDLLLAVAKEFELVDWTSEQVNTLIESRVKNSQNQWFSYTEIEVV